MDATWALWPQAWAAWVAGSAKGCPATISESSSPRTATVGPGRRPDSRALTPVSASPDRYFTPILSSRVRDELGGPRLPVARLGVALDVLADRHDLARPPVDLRAHPGLQSILVRHRLLASWSRPAREIPGQLTFPSGRGPAGLHLGPGEQQGEDHLDRAVQGQPLAADGRPRGLAALAVQLHQQVGRAVDHPRLIGKAGRRVDVADELDGLLDPVEIAEGVLHRAQRLDHRPPGRLVALLDRQVPPHEPGRNGLPSRMGTVPER